MRIVIPALFLSACVCTVEPVGFCASVDALACGVDTATCREPTPDPTDCDIPDPDACLAALYAAESCQQVLDTAMSAVCEEQCP